MGHLALEGPRETIQLQLTVPLTWSNGGNDDDLVQAVDEALRQELDALLAERTVHQPGRVYCLRCSQGDCEHSMPPSSRHIFEGYASSGQPRFADFGQWLLNRGHPRLDDLYKTPAGLITEVVSGEELAEDLTSAYDDEPSGFKLHGQVVAGWFPIRRANKTPATLAVALQVLSVRAKRRGKKRSGPGKPRYALNVVAAGPDGESLEELTARLHAIPWQGVARWGQQVLQSMASTRKGSAADRERRIAGMLQSMARRLDHDRRSRDRRTDHAEQRHRQGDRPTRMAQADMKRADTEQFLVDERRDTMIVLGQKGRAHVWNGAGKLVTSIRYGPDSVEKKIRQEIWRRASPDEVSRIRGKVLG